MPQQSVTNHAKRIAVAIRMVHYEPWHHACCEGILRFGEEQGWHCVIDPFLVGGSGHNGAADYDGVVGRLEPEPAAAAIKHGIPIVNHWVNTPVPDLPGVFMDYAQTGKLSGEHLLACGYRHFAYLGLDGDKVSRIDFGGFSKAIESRGFGPPTYWSCSPEPEEDRAAVTRFRTALIELLRSLPKPIGIHVHHAVVASHLVQICHELGQRVPNDVGVVLQGTDLRAFGPTSQLTYIEKDYFRVGYQAATLLHALLQGEAVHPLRRTVPPTRLVVRESTDVFLCDDPLVSDAIRYIADHCRETLLVEQVAEAVGVSESTLRRRFESATGRSVKEEIARLRTDHVKHLLTETTKPIARIADECGYSSPTQLGRYFTNAVGMTPNAYRKRHTQQPS